MTRTLKTAPAADQLADLIARARAAHESIQLEPAGALMRALDAGDALNAAKALVKHGEWSAKLAETGIPASTAQLYMQLARNRALIIAAGCTSIREARALISDRKPPRRKRAGRTHVGSDQEP
jgi:hypothetical protein